MINALKLELKNKLEEYLDNTYHEKINVVVEEPKKLELGDLSIPVFSAVKVLKKPLPEIANLYKDFLIKDDRIMDVKITGGFVNLSINKESLSSEIIVDVLKQKEHFGDHKKNNQMVVIDYSSPNIAKPFSIGHLRSTIIGNSLKLLYLKMGYDVYGINHLGDWGTQFGKVIVAYLLWGKKEEVLANPLKELAKLYVRFHKEAIEDPSLDDEGRRVFKELEQGNSKYLELWKWFREESLKESMNMYNLLDVKFDSFNGEAFFNDKMDDIVKELEDKHLLKEDAGAMIVDLGETMPPALIKRKDGATLYMTRDLAALKFRHNTYNFSKILYVVGSEQKLHFNQLKAVSSKLGWNYAANLEHVNFGLVMRDGKKMSTRDGRVVTLYEVLQSAIDMALKSIEEKNPSLENKEEVAKAVGIGAVMFNDLKNHRTLDIEFDLDSMLKFEGQTGPYLQYTSVRIKSILRDSDYDYNNMDKSVLSLDHYYEVVKLISQFSSSIEKAIADNAPSVIARYLLNLAQAFNKFYGAERINSTNELIRNTNMALAEATRIVLDEGLRLLGLKTLERM